MINNLTENTDNYADLTEVGLDGSSDDAVDMDIPQNSLCAQVFVQRVGEI